MAEPIRLVIYGNAVPQARARVFTDGQGKVRAITPPGTRQWREWIALEAKQHRPGALLDCPLRVEVDFFTLKPKSTPKRCQHPQTKPDLDNLYKAVTDALEGLIYTNDSRIVEAVTRKHYGNPPRVEVTIEPLAEEVEA